MTDEKLGPSADPEKVKRRKNTRQSREQNWRNWMTVVVGTYEGRALVWSILEESRLFQSSFAGEQPMLMAFREGKKQVGQFIYSWLLQSAPEAYKLMEKESKARQSEDQAKENEA
jgi:hypothetical protein